MRAGAVSVTLDGRRRRRDDRGQRISWSPPDASPTIEGLGLEAARYPPRPHRHFRQQEAEDLEPARLCDRRSSPPGNLQFTHAANYHAGLVIRNALFRMPVRVDQ